MFRKKGRFPCVHCGTKLPTRRERILHEALECPERPSVKK